MSSPSTAALRSELTEARVILEPRLRGLKGMVNDELSEAARVVITDQIDIYSALLDSYVATLGNLDMLDAAGFPALPNVTVPSEIFDEIRREIVDVTAAGDIFVDSTKAERIEFDPPKIRDTPLKP